MSEATPTPWQLVQARTLLNLKGPNGEQICQIPIEHFADACTLLRAVNCHEPLLAALRNAAGTFEKIERKALHWETTFAASVETAARWNTIKNNAHAAASEARAAIQLADAGDD